VRSAANVDAALAAQAKADGAAIWQGRFVDQLEDKWHGFSTRTEPVGTSRSLR
jgi:hypothetical protein